MNDVACIPNDHANKSMPTRYKFLFDIITLKNVIIEAYFFTYFQIFAHRIGD